LIEELSLYFRGSTSGGIPDAYINYLLCKTFSWTYEQLMSQPASFIEEILLTMGAENKAQRRWQKRG